MRRESKPTENAKATAGRDGTPCLAVRRHTDRCFFAAEEAVPGPDGALVGYVVEGVLIPLDEIAETRPIVEGAEACNGRGGRGVA